MKWHLVVHGHAGSRREHNVFKDLPRAREINQNRAIGNHTRDGNPTSGRCLQRIHHRRTLRRFLSLRPARTHPTRRISAAVNQRHRRHRQRASHRSPPQNFPPCHSILRLAPGCHYRLPEIRLYPPAIYYIARRKPHRRLRVKSIQISGLRDEELSAETDQLSAECPLVGLPVRFRYQIIREKCPTKPQSLKLAPTGNDANAPQRACHDQSSSRTTRSAPSGSTRPPNTENRPHTTIALPAGRASPAPIHRPASARPSDRSEAPSAAESLLQCLAWRDFAASRCAPVPYDEAARAAQSACSRSRSPRCRLGCETDCRFRLPH